jgi:hypothetical protein
MQSQLDKLRPLLLWNKLDQLLDHVATYLNDCIVYQASDMILCAHADPSFLNESQSCSQAGAHIFLLENGPFT